MPKQEKFLLQLDYCLTPTNRINNAAILVENGKIQALGGASAFVHLQNSETIEMPGCYALPGFVDTRLYGAGGCDCMHADLEDKMAGMSCVLAEHGVTSFLPTTQSHEPKRLLGIVEALAGMCREDLPGAVPVGIHLEGPFINPARRGAHPGRYIRDIDLDEARNLIRAAKGRIKALTFAPELEGALDLIRLLRARGIIPCMGHTMAQEQAVRAAIDAGATRCSHLYNGMEPLQQRQLGLAAISLIDERVWVEFIPDGVHCHDGMIDLACRSKAKDRLIGISNSMEAAGLPSGIYKLGDDMIKVTDGRATLDDGTIAGSVSFMDHNYFRLLSFAHLTQSETAAAFTLNPARSIGLDDRGELKPGKRADLVILDQNHQVQMTIANGRIAYRRDSEEGV